MATVVPEGGVKVMPQGKPNPTLDAGMEQAAAYQRLPQDLRSPIEQHPLVAQHGMQPHMAAALLSMSAPKGTPAGQKLQGALRRYMPERAPTLQSPGVAA
jgi:hypothetical protein